VRLLTACLFAALSVACSPAPQAPPDAGQPRTCVGGVVRDGVCEAKCDPARCLAGNTCVDNRCVLVCNSHADCTRYVQECRPAVEDDTGAALFTCQAVPFREYGDPCPNADECPVCLHKGPGDARAYCTSECVVDQDCPGGYECAPIRDPRQICGTQVGTHEVCGSTVEPCLDPSEITSDGIYVKGALCLLRKMCVQRGPCAPCASDVDCSWTGTKCTLLAPFVKICAAECNGDSDCTADKWCFDGRCLPRSGECTGENVFCGPCRFDTDCGPTGICLRLHGDEYACLDLTYPYKCARDTDCPLSPGGRRGRCITGGVCYFPYDGNVQSCY
jgi:hypothetical protein